MKARLDQELHRAFEVSLLVKAVFEVCEILAGVLVAFVNEATVLRVVHAVTQVELSEDPRDVVATYLLHAAQHFSASRQHFMVFFLLSHGIVKLWLIVELWRKKLRYYPLALMVFGGFILYQLYRFSLTHSALLLVITAVDGAVIWLTWMEYRHLRRNGP